MRLILLSLLLLGGCATHTTETQEKVIRSAERTVEHAIDHHLYKVEQAVRDVLEDR